MANFKKVAAILSVAILASTMSPPATASYIDGDREVDYYDFTIKYRSEEHTSELQSR